jgi:hypothetical protein
MTDTADASGIYRETADAPRFVETADCAEPRNWTRHVDPRDRSRRALKQLERQYPRLFLPPSVF